MNLLQAYNCNATHPGHRRQIYCKFLVLSFIHAALIQLQTSEADTEIYLSKLLQCIAEVDASADECPIYSLLWLLQKESSLSQFATFAQLAAGLQIALRLTDTGLSILNSALLGYLDLSDQRLPYLEKTLFHRMVFKPEDWKFTESLDNMIVP